MRNLIPAYKRKALRKDYLMRLATVGLGLFAVVMAIGTLTLAPTYFLAYSKLNAIRTEAGLVEESISRREEPMSVATLRETQDQLKIVLTEQDRDLLSDMVAEIVEQKLPGISITGIFYERGGVDFELTVTGIANQRDTLLAFKETLEALEWFVAVNLPVSNLATERNLSFTLRALGEL
jgi:Tfp pilus assembly protein PilN